MNTIATTYRHHRTRLSSSPSGKVIVTVNISNWSVFVEPW
jgi:hypothetical protein